ncbi:MAG TPA: metallophosphoesterase family protein, partial [Stellaceae bacterium]|nr:metallophosphoesterase family protein [Stellaceae bacterium]
MSAAFPQDVIGHDDIGRMAERAGIPYIPAMFAKLFGSRASTSPAVPPRIAEDTRLYAVGDIHGRLDLLSELERRIADDAAAAGAARNAIVYLGDYVDRGTQSREVVDRLIDQPLAGFERFLLLGNHEDSMLQFLVDVQIGPAWLGYGGAATLLSYGIRPPSSDRDLVRAQEELRAKLPEHHLAFLRGLQLSHVEGDFYFVHAGIKPGVPLEDQRPSDMLWIRDEFLHSRQDFGKIVVHGHTITETPEIRRNRIGIDTG